MDLKDFKDSLSATAPPPDLSSALQALWYERKGDWKTAHDRLQGEGNSADAWVHGYLHRREGDASNAAFWYRRAGKAMTRGAFEAEWENITTALLAQA